MQTEGKRVQYTLVEPNFWTGKPSGIDHSLAGRPEWNDVIACAEFFPNHDFRANGIIVRARNGKFTCERHF